MAGLLATTVATYGQNDNGQAALQKFNTALAAKVPEDSLSAFAIQYARIVKRQSAYDSLTQQIVAIYPKGHAAATKSVIDMYGEARNGNLNIDQFNKLKTDFPNIDFSDNTKQAGMYYSAIVGAAFPKWFEKDSASASGLIPQMGANSLNEVAWKYGEDGKHLSTAAKMSQLSLEKTQARLADSTKIPEKQKAEFVQNMKGTYASYADTYAYILAKQGKKKDALKYQTEAIRTIKDNSEMNSRYISLLNENGLYQQALTEGSAMYTANQGDKTMLEQINTAYKKVNKGKSSDTYISTLKTKQAEAAKKDLVKTLIDKPAPAFSLKNTKGETVSLSDYKGKVVVLDFWATWCGPCKMSFPGMQLAVNKYKDNANVVFLFIDTWETLEPTERHDAVTKFIQEKKYDFHVLLDNKVSDRDFEVAKAFTPFGITGIPVKFFIGKDGNVKFMATGYPGSDEKVLEEVIKPVDYLLEKS